MLLIILQLNLHFQLNNHPIGPPNAASGDLGNWKWNRIMVAVATYNYDIHFSFCFILIIPRLTEFWPFKCQGHPVSLWCWPLACRRQDNYDICIHWRDIALATYSRSQSLLNMNIEGNFEATLWRHRWRHHHEKNWHNLGHSFHIWGQIEAVFNI